MTFIPQALANKLRARFNKVTPHWITVAAERIAAGEPEADVLADYGYPRKEKQCNHEHTKRDIYKRAYVCLDCDAFQPFGVFPGWFYPHPPAKRPPDISSTTENSQHTHLFAHARIQKGDDETILGHVRTCLICDYREVSIECSPWTPAPNAQAIQDAINNHKAKP